MEKIIAPIEIDKLVNELTADKFVKYTNKGNNEIYLFDYYNSPSLMLEGARLREVSFRSAGGGTGTPLDLDIYDIQSQPYKQLIVWNPENKENDLFQLHCLLTLLKKALFYKLIYSTL
jgi:hypothetical protein